MMTRFVAAFLFALPLLSVVASPAQSLPNLDELLTRNAEFNRLNAEMRRSGKSVPQLEPLRLRGEQAFRAGKVDELLAILSEGIAILKGTTWDERQKFFASLTIEIN